MHYQGTIILCIYRQPEASDVTLIDLLTRFRAANSHHPIIIIAGDFNVHGREWLGSSYTSANGAALREFCKLCGLSQLVHRDAHMDVILDSALSEYTGTVSAYPIGLGGSNHRCDVMEQTSNDALF